ncbi:MAG: DUF4258 domain-containing protein [Candidatus Brocadia sp. AMX2]|uniref:DUF4258 domain-containing protein n=1 Tax=Candidatus Brocadia sinica JPN1 TaxID=1197129 RepID=A0ABQ0JZN9_9BACT|nr:MULTISPECIES: DUF4258 domain-containing protein [Brocadia]MBC6933813.1 DUF4258 domain-containing protein [Candidatus Brocadia sp.]MBL1170541.1 DUF4258 domain-containing protein [Candidatus Brocadia sp. AMX1]NOG42066.1 DUF4258 domain-containing protein [Planctomycetota bacterium]GIK14484.1 MAG: hypothetical protein BroJett002_31910 [Candidatus Brocadia sinica]KAA0242426.1 MAG: DUF4258 domain-containing protein [Candidatus Brocadia sp. AMX2]
MQEIEWIQERVRKGEYYFSRHGDQERQNDNLTIVEVEEALSTSRILEKYENTGRGESCLVAGFTNTGKPIHVVCGERGDWLVLITVYVPSPPKFKTPYERGEK